MGFIKKIKEDFSKSKKSDISKIKSSLSLSRKYNKILLIILSLILFSALGYFLYSKFFKRGNKYLDF